MSTDLRTRIVVAAAQLLDEGGPAAVTTRGVAEAAGTQAPAIYRIFGDKDGLLDAVAEHVMGTYVAHKAAVVRAAAEGNVDPLDDLADGWHNAIEFALANPTLFRMISDPTRTSPAARSGREVLEARIGRIAASGRLRISERRAVDLVQAAGEGIMQVLLATPPHQRDPGLAEAMYEAVLARILTRPAEHAPASDALPAAAVALRAAAPDLPGLSAAERGVLAEWLDRVIAEGDDA